MYICLISDEAHNWVLTTVPDTEKQRKVISASGAQLEVRF